MKVGIMGGTFDPIHIGHLLLGEFAYEDFGLDEIWFVPNGNPPHKETKDSEQALRNRVEMVRLAIEHIPYFKLDQLAGIQCLRYSLRKSGVHTCLSNLENRIHCHGKPF